MQTSDTPVFTAVVVNDDETQLGILSGLLRKAGLKVQPFQSAQEALTAVDRDHPPDLIVTDIYMPGIDGWRFCRLLRSPEYETLNQTPILVVSATFAGDEAARITADLGADAFLPAPVEGKRFIEQVRAILAGRSPRCVLQALIVEDSQDLAGALKTTFEAHGYAADTVRTTRAATEAFGKAAYDVVVLDHHLPDGQGDSLLADFRARRPDCVCIMMTTDPSPELALAWMRRGAAAHLRKPFQPDYLIELCARARRERALLRVEDLLEEKTRKLRQSKALLNTAERLTKVGGWEWDVEKEVMFWTEETYRIHGFPPGVIAPDSTEHVDRSLECYDPEDRPVILAAFQRCVQQGKPYDLEFPFTSLDGCRKWIRTTARPVLADGRVVKVIGNIRDITQRKKNEKDLHDSRQMLQTVLDSIPAAVFWKDRDSLYLGGNRTWLDSAGLNSSEEAVGKNDYELPWDKEQADSFREYDRMVTESGIPEYGIIEPYTRADGTNAWAKTNKVPLRDTEGNIVGVLGTYEDITERRQVEAERERLLSAIEQSGEIIVITDPEGNIQYVNPALERITGYSRQEALGKNMRILASSENDETLHQELWKTVAEGRTWQGRFVNRRKDGTLYTEEAAVSPVRDASGRLVNLVAVKRDITEHLRVHEEKAELERQFHQAQKLESVGRLAGGVAHDLNNLLTPILGYGDMLLAEFSGEDRRKASVEAVVQAAVRARDLVRQLLAFSRKQLLELKPVDLNNVLIRFNKLLRRTIREDVVIELKPAPSLPFIRGDIGQLEQVVMNLAVNAQDAMPDGGKLTIETAVVDLDEAYAERKPGVTPGAYVMLSIRDTGCGMDAETREHLFEPFFTTKPKDKGTGLGLATSYGIVKQHGGSIWVYSEPGEGTVFKVYLPVSDDTAAPKEDDSIALTDLRGSETILLVEDDKQVRDLACAILKRQGYSVIAAENGREALATLDRHEGSLNLLLTDVIMPGMSGTELFDRMSRACPDVKVLYMSGYTDDVIAHRGATGEAVHFIQKPFTVHALAAKVREVLDHDRESAS